MRRAAAFLSVVFAASAAHADVIPVAFSGTVDDGTYVGPPENTNFMPGQPIYGSFLFDTTTDDFTSFTIGGYSAPAGALTSFSQPLAATGFGFLKDKATDPVTGEPTAEFSINFYYEAALPSTTSIADYIRNPGAFSTDLAGTPSFFTAYLADAAGGTTVSGLLDAYDVPEPGAMMLLASGFAGLAFARRRIG